MSTSAIMLSFKVYSATDIYYASGVSSQGSFVEKLGSGADLISGEPPADLESAGSIVRCPVSLGGKYGDFRVRVYAENDLGLRSDFVEVRQQLMSPDIEGTYVFGEITVIGGELISKSIPDSSASGNVVTAALEIPEKGFNLSWELIAPYGHPSEGTSIASSPEGDDGFFKGFEIQVYKFSFTGWEEVTDSAILKAAFGLDLNNTPSFSLRTSADNFDKLVEGASDKRTIKIKITAKVSAQQLSENGVERESSAEIILSSPVPSFKTHSAEIVGASFVLDYEMADEKFSKIKVKQYRQNGNEWEATKSSVFTKRGKAGRVSMPQKWSNGVDSTPYSNIYRYIIELYDSFGLASSLIPLEAGGMSSTIDISNAGARDFEAVVKIGDVTVSEAGSSFNISWSILDSSGRPVEVGDADADAHQIVKSVAGYFSAPGGLDPSESNRIVDAFSTHTHANDTKRFGQAFLSLPNDWSKSQNLTSSIVNVTKEENAWIYAWLQNSQGPGQANRKLKFTLLLLDGNGDVVDERSGTGENVEPSIDSNMIFSSDKSAGDIRINLELSEIVQKIKVYRRPYAKFQSNPKWEYVQKDLTGELQGNSAQAPIASMYNDSEAAFFGDHTNASAISLGEEYFIGEWPGALGGTGDNENTNLRAVIEDKDLPLLQKAGKTEEQTRYDYFLVPHDEFGAGVGTMISEVKVFAWNLIVADEDGRRQVDDNPPGGVENLEVTGAFETFFLSWDAPSDNDVDKYKITAIIDKRSDRTLFDLETGGALKFDDDDSTPTSANTLDNEAWTKWEITSATDGSGVSLEVTNPYGQRKSASGKLHGTVIDKNGGRFASTVSTGEYEADANFPEILKGSNATSGEILISGDQVHKKTDNGDEQIEGVEYRVFETSQTQLQVSGGSGQVGYFYVETIDRSGNYSKVVGEDTGGDKLPAPKKLTLGEIASTTLEDFEEKMTENFPGAVISNGAGGGSGGSGHNFSIVGNILEWAGTVLWKNGESYFIAEGRIDLSGNTYFTPIDAGNPHAGSPIKYVYWDPIGGYDPGGDTTSTGTFKPREKRPEGSSTDYIGYYSFSIYNPASASYNLPDGWNSSLAAVADYRLISNHASTLTHSAWVALGTDEQRASYEPAYYNFNDVFISGSSEAEAKFNLNLLRTSSDINQGAVLHIPYESPAEGKHGRAVIIPDNGVEIVKIDRIGTGWAIRAAWHAFANAVIGSAHIGKAAILDAHINTLTADKITGGRIHAGETIELGTDNNGTSEIRAGTFSGTSPNESLSKGFQLFGDGEFIFKTEDGATLKLEDGQLIIQGATIKASSGAPAASVNISSSSNFVQLSNAETGAKKDVISPSSGISTYQVNVSNAYWDGASSGMGPETVSVQILNDSGQDITSLPGLLNLSLDSDLDVNEGFEFSLDWSATYGNRFVKDLPISAESFGAWHWEILPWQSSVSYAKDAIVSGPAWWTGENLNAVFKSLQDSNVNQSVPPTSSDTSSFWVYMGWSNHLSREGGQALSAQYALNLLNPSVAEQITVKVKIRYPKSSGGNSYQLKTDSSDQITNTAWGNLPATDPGDGTPWQGLYEQIPEQWETIAEDDFKVRSDIQRIDGIDGAPGASIWYKWDDTKLQTQVSSTSPGSGWAQTESDAIELKGGQGDPLYTWIRYANDANGTGLVDTWTAGKNYIGIKPNNVSDTESTTPGDYSWTKIEGADGTDGLSVYITYNDNSIDNPPSTPTGDGTTPAGWHTAPTSDCKWMSQRVGDSLSAPWDEATSYDTGEITTLGIPWFISQLSSYIEGADNILQSSWSAGVVGSGNIGDQFTGTLTNTRTAGEGYASINGDANIIEIAETPSGEDGLVWVSRENDSADDGEGGWLIEYPGLNANKRYLSVVYIKVADEGGYPEGSHHGIFYHGTAYYDEVEMLGGVGNSSGNPYFSYFPTKFFPEGVWCVSIGFIHPYGTYSTGATNPYWGGVYRLDTGAKLSLSGVNGADFQWTNTSSSDTSQFPERTGSHRAYLYYDNQPPESSVEMHFYAPGLFEVPDSETQAWLPVYGDKVNVAFESKIDNNVGNSPPTYGEGDSNWENVDISNAETPWGSPIAIKGADGKVGEHAFRLSLTKPFISYDPNNNSDRDNIQHPSNIVPMTAMLGSSHKASDFGLGNDLVLTPSFGLVTNGATLLKAFNNTVTGSDDNYIFGGGGDHAALEAATDNLKPLIGPKVDASSHYDIYKDGADYRILLPGTDQSEKIESSDFLFFIPGSASGMAAASLEGNSSVSVKATLAGGYEDQESFHVVADSQTNPGDVFWSSTDDDNIVFPSDQDGNFDPPNTSENRSELRVYRGTTRVRRAPDQIILPNKTKFSLNVNSEDSISYDRTAMTSDAAGFRAEYQFSYPGLPVWTEDWDSESSAGQKFYKDVAPSTNILSMSSWAAGSVPSSANVTTLWEGANYAKTEGEGNFIETAETPYGDQGLVWVLKENDVWSDSDGGWSVNNILNGSKRHLSIVYVKVLEYGQGSDPDGGYWYHGGYPGYSLNEFNGAGTTTSPYFEGISVTSLPLGVWCVNVGYIHPYGWGDLSGENPSWGGLYRLDTCEKISPGVDFQHTASWSVNNGHRCRLVYDANPVATSDKLHLYDPGIFEVSLEDDSSWSPTPGNKKAPTLEFLDDKGENDIEKITISRPGYSPPSTRATDTAGTRCLVGLGSSGEVVAYGEIPRTSPRDGLVKKFSETDFYISGEVSTNLRKDSGGDPIDAAEFNFSFSRTSTGTGDDLVLQFKGGQQLIYGDYGSGGDPSLPSPTGHVDYALKIFDNKLAAVHELTRRRTVASLTQGTVGTDGVPFAYKGEYRSYNVYTNGSIGNSTRDLVTVPGETDATGRPVFRIANAVITENGVEVGQFSGKDPTNDAFWGDFVGQYESMATGLLLSQDIIVERGVVTGVVDGQNSFIASQLNSQYYALPSSDGVGEPVVDVGYENRRRVRESFIFTDSSRVSYLAPESLDRHLKNATPVVEGNWDSVGVGGIAGPGTAVNIFNMWESDHQVQAYYYSGRQSPLLDPEENFIEKKVTHRGELANTWVAKNSDAEPTDGGGDYDGGWHVVIPASAIDTSKRYLSVVYFKVESLGGPEFSGYIRHLAQPWNTNNLDDIGGAGNEDWPDFIYDKSTSQSKKISEFEEGVWFVSVGYVHPWNSTYSENPEWGGVYRLDTGAKVVDGTDYKFETSSDPTTTFGMAHYTRVWWEANTPENSTEIHFMEPGVFELPDDITSPWSPPNQGPLSRGGKVPLDYKTSSNPLNDYLHTNYPNTNGYDWFSDQTDWDHYVTAGSLEDAVAAAELDYASFGKTHWTSGLDSADRENRSKHIRIQRRAKDGFVNSGSNIKGQSSVALQGLTSHKTPGDNSPGYFLGYIGEEPQFELYKSGTSFLRWDGTNLEVKGAIIDASVADTSFVPVSTSAGALVLTPEEGYKGQVFVGGGFNNSLENSGYNLASSILGGGSNSIIGTDSQSSRFSSISGGYGNLLTGNFSNIGGGYFNKITDGELSSILGGARNSIYDSSYSLVGSGFDNLIFNSKYSSILNGQSNVVSSQAINPLRNDRPVIDASGALNSNETSYVGWMVSVGSDPWAWRGGTYIIQYDDIEEFFQKFMGRSPSVSEFNTYVGQQYSMLLEAMRQKDEFCKGRTCSLFSEVNVDASEGSSYNVPVPLFGSLIIESHDVSGWTEFKTDFADVRVRAKSIEDNFGNFALGAKNGSGTWAWLEVKYNPDAGLYLYLGTGGGSDGEAGTISAEGGLLFWRPHDGETSALLTERLHDNSTPTSAKPSAFDIITAIPEPQVNSTEYYFNSIVGGDYNSIRKSRRSTIVGGRSCVLGEVERAVVGGLDNLVIGHEDSGQLPQGFTVFGKSNIISHKWNESWGSRNYVNAFHAVTGGGPDLKALANAVLGNDNRIRNCSKTAILGSNNELLYKQGFYSSDLSFNPSEDYTNQVGSEITILGTDNKIALREQALVTNLGIFGTNFILSEAEMVQNTYYIGNPKVEEDILNLTRLFVAADGGAFFTGDVIAFALSDKKHKKNVLSIEQPIDKIMKIRGITFDWKDTQTVHKGRDVGVLAQEIEKVLPEVVEERVTGKAVKYEKIVPLLIEGIKEQQRTIAALELRVNNLEKGSGL